MHNSLIFMEHRLRSGGVLPARGARGTRSLKSRKGLNITLALSAYLISCIKSNLKIGDRGAPDGPLPASVEDIRPQVPRSNSSCCSRWPKMKDLNSRNDSISGPSLPSWPRDNWLKEQGKLSRILPVNFLTTGPLNFIIFLLFWQIWITDLIIYKVKISTKLFCNSLLI